MKMVAINYFNHCCILLLPTFFHLFICSTIVQSVIVNTNRPSHNSHDKSKQSGSGNRNVAMNSGSQYGSQTRPNSEFHSEDYSTEQTNEERRLFNYLMRNYDSTIRPVSDATKPINIRLGITLTQIFDLDEKNQVLTTNVWLDQEWVDDFLTWNSSDFGNLTKIRIPCQSIWLPDIVLYNNADDYTRGYMNSRAVITPDGNVFWPPPTKFRSTCPVDVTYFPFDDQTCKMKFGSWIYDGLQVNIENRTEDVDLNNYVANGEWDLIKTSLVRNVVFYPCCIEPFPDVTIKVTIRRKVLYYMYNVILPCIMMSALTLLVFCLPPESGEKIALGVTVLLAFSVFMLAISEKLPETSESIPLLGVYLTVVMGITSISIIMTVVVLNFHYCSPVNKRELPEWLRKLIKSKSVLDDFYCPKFEYLNNSNNGILNGNGSSGTATNITTTTMLQHKMKAMMLEEVKLRHTTQTHDPSQLGANQTSYSTQHSNNTNYSSSKQLESNYKLWNNIVRANANKTDRLSSVPNVNYHEHQIRQRTSIPDNSTRYANVCNQNRTSQQQSASKHGGRIHSTETTPTISAHQQCQSQQYQYSHHHHHQQTRGSSNFLSKYNKIYTISGDCKHSSSSNSHPPPPPPQEQRQSQRPKRPQELFRQLSNDFECSFDPESDRHNLVQTPSNMRQQSNDATDTSVLKGKCDFSSSSSSAATRIIDDLYSQQQQTVSDSLYNNIIASNCNKASDSNGGNCGGDGTTRSMITSIAPYFACAASQIIKNNSQISAMMNPSSRSKLDRSIVNDHVNCECSCKNARNENYNGNNKSYIFNRSQENGIIPDNDTAADRYFPNDNLVNPNHQTANINRSVNGRESINKLSDHHYNDCCLNDDNNFHGSNNPVNGSKTTTPIKPETPDTLPRSYKDDEESTALPSAQNEEVLQMLRYLMYRQDVEDNYGRRIHEWKLLSMFIDKILFWIFTVFTVVTSLVFLVIIPIQRRGF